MDGCKDFEFVYFYIVKILMSTYIIESDADT